MRTLLSRLAFLVVLALAGQAHAAEEILSFKSRIVVEADGALTVTETIRARAEGDQIKRGIYRDLPDTYTAPDGTTQRMHYGIQRVLRDGAGIATFETGEGPGRRIYFGSKDIYIQPGVYTYEFTYRAMGQVRFFDAFDEVYWNVTGNDWAFPINKAEAVVVLPPGARPERYAAYTGRAGATGKDFSAFIDAAGRVGFATTRRLGRGEGLTVAVGWPKGFVTEPDAAQQTASALFDNLPSIVSAVGLLLVLAYYLWAWDRVGRDPDAGPVAPLFAPPEGFSPAMTRTLMKMGFDKKAFAAAIVNLAVKGAVSIREDGGDFTLSPMPFSESAALSRGEAALLKNLLPGRRPLELKRVNRTRIRSALSVFKDHLQQELERTHFNTNRGYLVPGAVLSVLAVGAAALSMPSPGESIGITVFMSVWLSMWTFGCFALARRALMSWQAGSYFSALFQSAFAVPFFGGELMGLGLLREATSTAHAVFLFVMVGLFALFYYLLKAPTLKGRRVMDQLEGFRMFLEVAEKDRLNMFHPPDLTPEKFQEFLPYAMALDVEHAWGERFAELLRQAGRDPNESPGWYHGGGWHSHGGAGFADHLSGGLSSAVSSASSASSGSGGGGFSGGGGGGGGGGGF